MGMRELFLSADGVMIGKRRQSDRLIFPQEPVGESLEMFDYANP